MLCCWEGPLDPISIRTASHGTRAAPSDETQNELDYLLEGMAHKEVRVCRDLGGTTLRPSGSVSQRRQHAHSVQRPI